MLASDFITRARTLLQDDDATRWPNVELLLWLSDAQRDLAAQVPESFTTTTNVVVLANATRQTMPANATRLFDITRNMGTTGTVPGQIIRLVDRKIFDHVDPDWPQAVAAIVEHYLYDFKNPTSFSVYPRVAANVFVEMVYGYAPAEVTALNATIPVSDLYASVIVDGIVFRAFSKDSDAASPQVAAAYKALFDAKIAQIVGATAQRTPADASGGSQA